MKLIQKVPIAPGVGIIINNTQGVVFLARADFGVDDDAAPLDSPYVEGETSLTLVQLDGQYSIADELLHGSLNATAAYTDEGWYTTDSIARAAGLMATVLMRMTTLGTNVLLDVRSTAAIGFMQTTQGFMYQTGSIRDRNSQIIDVEPAANEWHWYGIIVKDTGVIWTYDDRIIRVVRAGTTDPIYFAHSNHSAVEDIRALLVRQLPGSLAAANDIILISDAAPSADEVYAAEPNILLDVDWTPSASEVLDIQIRRIDDDNCIIMRCTQASGNISLYEKVAGVETLVTGGSASQTFTAGTPYHLTFRSTNYRFAVWVDDSHKQTNRLMERNYYGSGVKVTSANLTNLVIRPTFITDTNWRASMRLFTGTNARRTVQVPTQAQLTTDGDTIDDYIAQLRPGDILRFTANETYTITGDGFNNIPSGTYHDNTLIDGNGATISGGVVGMELSNLRYCTIQDIEILDSTFQCLNVSNCSYITFNNCVFRSTADANFNDTTKLLTSDHLVFNSCTAGPSTGVATCDGFEFYYACYDCECNNCTAIGLSGADGNGFEVYCETGQGECYNITFNDCHAEDCGGYGFSNEGGPESRSNPNIVVNRATVTNNTDGDYRGTQGSTLYISDCQAGVEVGSVVTL